jgi:hypothetical protein
MSTDQGLKDRALDALARIHNQTLERSELELNEIRAAMMAVNARCEQSLSTMREARLVPFGAVSELVTALCAAADAERQRAATTKDELEAARHELEDVRADSRAQIAAAHEAAARHREETVASCLRELNAARELAMSAMSAESRVREELAAMQTRNQGIVDAQMLRLAELKRELEAASAETERAHLAAETASRQVPVAVPAAKPAAAPNPKSAAATSTPKPTPAPVPKPAAAPAPEAVQSESEDIILEPEPSRHHLAPLFSAIDAALAENPPVPVWEEKVGA